MPSSSRPLRPDASGALLRALDESIGAALVLDERRRVVGATGSAVKLLGFPVRRGVPAVKILCGSGSKRPVAEALAAGRTIRAVIPHPGREAGSELAVCAAPLVGDGSEAGGWLLRLSDANGREAPGAVLFHGMWTQDPAMKHMFRVLERVAADDFTVLVRGETGAGKELVAAALHALSPRRAGPFRAINCAALPPSLLESELFGHAKGSFTGAVRDAPGQIQLAHGGTLFLDEVAELPLEIQAKLLRFVETRTVLPVGARDPVAVDVRVVSATHRALRREVEAGRFRADLMYRLRVIPVFLPALRERPGDVRLLCDKLVERMNATSRRRVERVSPAAYRVLEAYAWPGNVRELKNVLAYAYAVGEGPVLGPADLPPELTETSGATAPSATSASVPERALEGEAARLQAVLDRVGGSRERAAGVLGVSRVTLWRRMRALGLGPRGRRSP